MEIKLAEQNLLDAKHALDELDVPFFLSNGTLLGFYRDGGLIGHDRDVDVGIKIIDFKNGIVEKFEEYGFSFKGSNGFKENGLEYSFVKRDIGLDIFFYYDTPYNTWMAVWEKTEGLRYKYVYPSISEYKTVEFLGEEFRIPTNTDEYLCAQYGNWEEPTSDWDCFSSPKNIEADYWEEFYKVQHPLEPSPMALSLNLGGQRIVDIGCGNGRDTLYFAKNNSILGIDKLAPDGEIFRRQTIENFIKAGEHIDVLYCRFLLHAIPNDLQTEILKWGKCYANTVYIECRSDKGTVPDYSHHRRLINSDSLIKECLSMGYKIGYFIEDTGLAKTSTEDPVIIRLYLNS